MHPVYARCPDPLLFGSVSKFQSLFCDIVKNPRDLISDRLSIKRHNGHFPLEVSIAIFQLTNLNILNF